MAAQLIDIKAFVADLIGTGDATTAVPKRDRLINAARRRFYSEHKWSFLKVKKSAITISSQLGDLPSDFNIKFDPTAVYVYNGSYKYQYQKVAWDDLEMYGTSDYVFAVDKVNKKIKISQTSVSTVYMDYQYLPADKAVDTTDDTDEEPIDDITPIGLLSLALWFQSARQSIGRYEMYMDEYKEELVKWIINDTGSKDIKKFNRPIQLETGYRGQN